MAANRRNQWRQRWQRRRGLEPLEPRQLLAADTVTLVDDVLTVHQNSAPLVLQVLDNDLFGEEYAGPRELSAVSFGSEGGRIEIAEDRQSVVYTPPADFEGREQFSYFVDGSYFATVKVEVESPLREDRVFLVPDGRPHVLDVLRNDPFWEGYGGPRRITLVSVTSSDSSVQIAADGKSLVYQATENPAEVDSFIYIVDEIYPMSVTVRTRPAVVGDEYDVLQNLPEQRLDVLLNDPFWDDYDGPRRITHVGPSEMERESTIEIAADGKSLLYTPAANERWNDRFVYVVDGRFEASVTVYLQRPAVDDWYEIDINSRDQALNVLDNDSYWSHLQRRTIDIVDRVTSVGPTEQGGSVRILPDGRGLVYDAPPDFEGTDTFQYTANDWYTASVSVHVTRPVRDDYLTAYQDTPNQLLPVAENDFLGNGYPGPRQLTGVSESEQLADLAIVGSAVQYTPPVGFVGGDEFTYSVDQTLEARTLVSVVPLAQYDWFNFCPSPNQTHTLNVLGNDHFRRGYLGPGKITAAELLDGDGQVSVSPDGTILHYRPGSKEQTRIKYTVDGQYETEAVVWQANYLQYDQQVVDQNSDPVSMDVLANDFSYIPWNCSARGYTGHRLITGVSPSQHGGVVRVANGGRSVVYEPAADFFGTDTFTYVVDGTMESTVQVQVVRRVRDDQVRVRPGETDSLAVIANDLFGGDYQGAQRITDVTSSTLGATVQIAPDGRHLLYTAPSGVEGRETLTYTVDGRLKAEVEIDVRPDGTSPFDQFGSLTEFQEFLIQDALTRYAGLFGQPAYNYFFSPGENADSLQPGPLVDASSNRDFSKTNVQVAGIDEADIVEFDADYVYFLTGDDVVILDAWPADQLHEVSRTPIVGDAIAQYLNGDRLTVISEIVTWARPEPFPVDDVLVDVIRPVDFFRYQPAEYETVVTVLDVSDRAQPKQVQRTTMEGRYVQSRGIGDYVYVAVSNDAVALAPRIIPAEDAGEDWGPQGTYETEDEYLERVRANLGEFIDEALPSYVSVGAGDEVVRSGLVHEPEDIFRPLSEGAGSLVSLLSINVTNSEPGLSGASGVYTNGATQIYASLNHFYIFENGYEPEDGNVTRVLQFDWNKDDGSARFSSAGFVPGYMLNQFSADEYEGHLRIVTTVSHAYSGSWTGTSENDLFVLRDDGGTLEFTGSLQNLGLGETARSVRFMGPRAFLVTFQNVDPLFGLDVSDPTNPKSVGHLTLPGFSSYMQLIDDHHLLTVGRNTPGGTAGPTQVSLFDVTDLTQPRLLDEYTMERFSQSEAEADHHAFGYFARHGLLAVPSVRSYVVRTDRDEDGYAESREWLREYELMVFRIDVEASPGSNLGVQLVADITHDSPVRRSGYIDDKLFSIAEDSIHVVDVAAPDTILATAADLKQHDPDPPLPEVALDEVAAIFQAAQLDLSARLSLPVGAVMPISAEQGIRDWQSVVRVNDVYYRYEGEADALRLTSVGFEFGGAGEAVSWQNPREPADVNGDGQITPNDAILLIQQLAGGSNQTLSGERVLRQIQDAQQGGGPYWDVNGDGMISPRDVLAVVQQFNQTATRPIDTGQLRTDDPATLADIAAVDAFYRRVAGTAGDANLDGRFDSADLVQVFQRGKYEDAIAQNALWSDGDWNGDGDFTTSDLVLAFVAGPYESDGE